MERKVGSLIKRLFAELWGEFREINKRHVRPLGLGTLENSVKQWENRPSNRENISAAHSPKVQGKETVTKWERGREAGRVEQSVAALHRMEGGSGNECVHFTPLRQSWLLLLTLSGQLNQIQRTKSPLMYSKWTGQRVSLRVGVGKWWRIFQTKHT